PTVRWAAASGAPPVTRHTSVLVPPMSTVTASGYPAATAAADPARTPPAGPESSSATGTSAASAAGSRPAADVITSTSSASGPSRRRYSRQTGPSDALMTVVTVRSYSRNSGETSDEHDTSRSRPASAAATALSWAAFRSAWSRQTATSTPSSDNAATSLASTGSNSWPVASRRP